MELKKRSPRSPGAGKASKIKGFRGESSDEERSPGLHLFHRMQAKYPFNDDCGCLFLSEWAGPRGGHYLKTDFKRKSVRGIAHKNRYSNTLLPL